MAPTTKAIAAFLEAHYYSGGLRHHHVALKGPRPDWAPPCEDVGFRDEFPLSDGDVVIEFQRRNLKGNLLTWVAMYASSVDEKLGDRANHSGIGLWLCGLCVTDARSVVHGLQQLMTVVSGSAFNSKHFETHATKFLADWLPRYVEDAAPFQLGFSGVPYAESALSNTCIYELQKDGVVDPFDRAADQLMMLSFGPQPVHPSRALIYIPGRNSRSIQGLKVDPIKADTDYLSELISAIPSALRDASNDLLALRAKVAEFEQSLRDLSEEKNALSRGYSDAIRDRDEARERVDILEREISKGGSSRDFQAIMNKLDKIYSGQLQLEKIAFGNGRVPGARNDGGRGKASVHLPAQTQPPKENKRTGTTKGTILHYGRRILVFGVFVAVAFGLGWLISELIHKIVETYVA